MTGGTVTITKSYEGFEAQNMTISGGTLHITASDDGLNAAGGNDASGMAQNFSTDSTQACILYTTGSCAAGTPVALKDTDGNTLASYSPAKPFSSVVITAPGLEENADFVLVIGDDEYELTLNGYLYGNGGGDSMGAMGKPGRPGGR